MEIIKNRIGCFWYVGTGVSRSILSARILILNFYKIVERSKELSKERYPQASIVRSFKELTEDPEIDLIVVNTPDNTHYEYAGMALEAGKNVVVEKPFTSTTKQGEELIALAKKKGLMLSVYQNRRWDADFLTIRDILAKSLLGRFGRI